VKKIIFSKNSVKIFNCQRIQDLALFFVKIFDHCCCSPRQFQPSMKKTFHFSLFTGQAFVVLQGNFNLP